MVQTMGSDHPGLASRRQLTLRLAWGRPKGWLSATPRFHDHDAVVSANHPQLHHYAQPTRLRHAEKLDGRSARAALLHRRQSGLQRRSRVHRHSQDSPWLLQKG